MPGFERNEAGKLFVGGLSWDTSKDSLLEYFSQYGEVVDCIVMKNQETGKSRGFGFVTYRDPSCLEVVLSMPAHIVDGRQVDPKACNPKGQQRGGMERGGGHSMGGDGGGQRQQRNERGGGGGGGGGRGGGGGGGGQNGDRKVFMGGLPNNADEAAIKNFFGQYGKVLDVKVMYDNDKQRSRGFGFLTFETDDAVNAVCREHFINFNGKKVECKRATPRDRSGNDEPQGGMGMPHPHVMQQVEMSIHGGSGPQHGGQHHGGHGGHGPDQMWGGQEQHWGQQQVMQSPPAGHAGPPGGQYGAPGGMHYQPQYQAEQPHPGAPPSWPPAQHSQAAGWPPGGVPPPQQPGMAPVPSPYMAQPVSAPGYSTQQFQSPQGAPAYQYAASPPGAAQPHPGPNGQMPPGPVGQPVSTLGYTSPTYGAPSVAVQQGAPRPGYAEFTAAAYGSTPVGMAQGQVVAGADPAAPKAAVDYSSYYSAYGYSVEGAPGAAAGGAVYGQPAPAQVPVPAQSPYGSPEPAPQSAAGYAGAPGPSPTYQRPGAGQQYHPYARR